jgi:hypothetical protein
MSGITYTRLDPTSRDDALTKIKSLLLTIVAFGLTLLNAGTGIGKSLMLRAMAKFWYATYGNKSVIHLIGPNEMIGRQLLDAAFGDGFFTIFQVKDFKTSTALENAVLDALDAGKRVLTYSYSLGHSDGELSRITDRICILMDHLKENGIYQLALLDELHAVLTTLVGGMNARLNHATSDMEHYGKIRAQKDLRSSLNLFDKFRKAGAHVVACSATLNNLICSKLPTLGYDPSKIQIWNVFPIEDLYKDLRFVPLDTSNFDSIAPYLLDAEAGSGKILLSFSGKKGIADFRAEYKRRFGREVSALEIISGTDHTKTAERLKTAKYVIGINLLGTGFDLKSHGKDAEFTLGSLFRDFSDKGSQPLSSNPFHPLHMEESARRVQNLGRMRKGGIFLVPAHYDEDMSLYRMQLKISQIIHEGHTQFEKFCVRPEILQPALYHQGLMLSMIQNLRYGDERPVVAKILSDLAVLAPGRNFKRESSNPATFEPLFWTRVFGICWERYYEEYDRKTRGTEALIPHSAKTMSDIDLIRTGRDYRDRIMVHSGRGYREGREIEERVKEEVFARACGRCIHCSLPVSLEDRQIAHFKRHAAGGPASLDNLVMAHRACDASFDAGDLIHSPSGTFWRHPRINYAPDRRQLRFINPEYIRARWEEQKLLRGKTTDDSVFRTWLTANGYTQYRWA